jgi:amino acid adenylation domain-containing protein
MTAESTMSRERMTLPLDYGGPVNVPFEPFPYSALDSSIIDRFDAVARRFPERLAVQDLTRSLTYAELATLVDQIAAVTSGATAQRPGPVAILLKSEAHFPAAMLGVLAAGRAYVPLDADQPIARNQLIAHQAGAAALISSDDLAEEARSLFPKHLPVVDLERLDQSPCKEPIRRPGPDDVAYIVYTSGSTGVPKGVYRDHRSLLHDNLQFTNTLHLNCDDRLSLVFSPSVNVATRNIYGALLNGGSLHILPPLELGSVALGQKLRSRGITVFHAAPTLFRRVARTLGPSDRLDGVRVVFLSTERSHWGDVDEFRRVCPAGSLLYVALASSECTIHVHWFVDDSVRASSAQLPVGRAIADRNVTLINDDGSPVGDDEIGEVVVASPYIASGYWNAPDLTRQAFSVDPANPKVRIFKTGDMGRWRADGLFEWIGRKDEQVKLHGHRIHPAEIENALSAFPEVADAAVVVRRGADGLPRSLAAYVTLRADVQGLLPRHLAAMLQQRLPHYLVPWPIIIVDDLPRLPSLKIDRLALAEMDASRMDEGSRGIENPIIAEVARVFEQVLQITGATGDDNIASLGGDSLLAVDIAAELERRFGVIVSDETMASAHTIQELALWIADQQSSLSEVNQDTHVCEKSTP